MNDKNTIITKIHTADCKVDCEIMIYIAVNQVITIRTPNSITVINNM